MDTDVVTTDWHLTGSHHRGIVPRNLPDRIHAFQRWTPVARDHENQGTLFCETRIPYAPR